MWFIFKVPQSLQYSLILSVSPFLMSVRQWSECRGRIKPQPCNRAKSTDCQDIPATKSSCSNLISLPYKKPFQLWLGSSPLYLQPIAFSLDLFCLSSVTLYSTSCCLCAFTIFLTQSKNEVSPDEGERGEENG